MHLLELEKIRPTHARTPVSPSPSRGVHPASELGHDRQLQHRHRLGQDALSPTAELILLRLGPVAEVPDDNLNNCGFYSNVRKRYANTKNFISCCTFIRNSESSNTLLVFGKVYVLKQIVRTRVSSLFTYFVFLSCLQFLGAEESLDLAGDEPCCWPLEGLLQHLCLRNGKKEICFSIFNFYSVGKSTLVVG